MKNDNLLVGIETSDDAAVYRIDASTAMIQTVDFFTPIVDDPYLFGQIAAANSLSDIYAMGGKPVLALNLACFPACLDSGILAEILNGGASKIIEAGAVLGGGHTIQDDEPKYGLCVTGMVHPEQIWRNSSAKPGDVLILTKPIGSGILTTAAKGGLISEGLMNAVIKTMITLNKKACNIFREFHVQCCTDITGFGLAGHAMEMAKGSQVLIELYTNRISLLPDVKEFAGMGLVPEGTYRNIEYFKDDFQAEGISTTLQDIMFDPQTSGGLLAAISPSYASAAIRRLREVLDLPVSIVGTVKPRKESEPFLVII